MRYIKYTTEIIELINTDINDLTTIKSIFSYIKDHSLFCSLLIDGLPIYSKCKILELTNDKIKYMAYIGKSSFVKSTSLQDIRQLKVETLDDKTIALGKEFGRGDTLGILEGE
jgi:hypothetical protein